MGIFAYLDPGTGSLVMQFIVGGILAVGVFVKAYWSKIKALFGGKKSSADSSKSDSKTKEEE